MRRRRPPDETTGLLGCSPELQSAGRVGRIPRVRLAGKRRRLATAAGSPRLAGACGWLAAPSGRGVLSRRSAGPVASMRGGRSEALGTPS